jgi:hypothetical protein
MWCLLLSKVRVLPEPSKQLVSVVLARAAHNKVRAAWLDLAVQARPQA